MYKKSKLHVQSCCFAYKTYRFFAVLAAVAVIVLKLLTIHSPLLFTHLQIHAFIDAGPLSDISSIFTDTKILVHTGN